MAEPGGAAGLSPGEVEKWRASAPGVTGPLAQAAAATCAHLARGEELLASLPVRASGRPPEAEAAAVLARQLDEVRAAFLGRHAEEIYDTLTSGRRSALRVDELLAAAAQRYPCLVPSREALERERSLRLADKTGIEFSQGLFLSSVLASPQAGSHLVWAMLRPTAAALELLPEFRRSGRVELTGALVERRGKAVHVELRNPRHLNAEDCGTLPGVETAVDLALLDPDTELGVFRGGVVDHPRYAGARVFGAGINLTHLYLGRIDFLFYVTRDLGYVNKLFRGLSSAQHRPREPEDTTEKMWIAAVETYAIGGACQLLHTIDHVIATRGSHLSLPARKEGIIPGASNLRLPRSVGDRLARRAILSGLEFEAGTPHGDLLCDEIVEPDEMDAAIDARVAALTSSGLVNAAANRRALRAGAEPLDAFRSYMATYCREQAVCHLSPALVHNLEVHWNARERRL
jgi:(3,5-dihydroxyphenyl)acetyl-CoA 1,2-dioxygenase